MVSRFLVSVQPASSLAWMAVCLIASVLAAQTGSPAPDAVLLDSKSASRMLVNEVKPEYPALAKVNYIQGAVRMQLRVTREGRDVGAVRHRAEQWTFRPARWGTRPGPWYLDVHVSVPD